MSNYWNKPPENWYERTKRIDIILGEKSFISRCDNGSVIQYILNVNSIICPISKNFFNKVLLSNEFKIIKRTEYKCLNDNYETINISVLEEE